MAARDGYESGQWLIAQYHNEVRRTRCVANFGGVAVRLTDETFEAYHPQLELVTN